MARKDYDKKMVSCYLPSDLEKQLEQYCREQGLTRKAKGNSEKVEPSWGTGIVQILEDYFNNQVQDTVQSTVQDNVQAETFTREDIEAIVNNQVQSTVQDKVQSETLTREEIDAIVDDRVTERLKQLENNQNYLIEQKIADSEKIKQLDQRYHDNARDIGNLQDCYPEIKKDYETQKEEISDHKRQLEKLWIQKVDQNTRRSLEGKIEKIEVSLEQLQNTPSQIATEATESTREDDSHQETAKPSSLAKINESMTTEEKIEILADDDRWVSIFHDFSAKDTKPFLEKLLIESGIESEGFSLSANDVGAFYKDHFAQSSLTTQQQKSLTRAKGYGQKGNKTKTFNAYKLFSLAVEKVKDKN